MMCSGEKKLRAGADEESRTVDGVPVSAVCLYTESCTGMVGVWGPQVFVYLSVLPGGDEADFQLDLSLMLLIDLKHVTDQHITGQA